MRMRQAVIGLRHFAAMATIGRESYINPECKFFERDTADDLAQATSKYKQFEEALESHLSMDLVGELSELVWGLISAYEQYAYEAGVRSGFALANDLRTSPPSIAEIEHLAREMMVKEGKACG